MSLVDDLPRRRVRGRHADRGARVVPGGGRQGGQGRYRQWVQDGGYQGLVGGVPGLAVLYLACQSSLACTIPGLPSLACPVLGTPGWAWLVLAGCPGWCCPGWVSDWVVSWQSVSGSQGILAEPKQ